MAADSASWSLEMEYARFLEKFNRLDEAEARLLRVMECSGPSCEVHLFLGRIYEKTGRAQAAVDAFKKAAHADPSSPKPPFELARLINRISRSDEAAAQAALASPKSPLRRERVLPKTLITQGKLGQAESALVKILTSDSIGAESSWTEALLKLIDRGRYGPALERALLGLVRGAGALNESLFEWPWIFSALMCAHKYQAAFRLGETALDAVGWSGSFQTLRWPWCWKVKPTAPDQRFLAQELRRIRAAQRGEGFPHWFAYCRVVLVSKMRPSDTEAVLAEYSPRGSLDVAKYTTPRYSWMLQVLIDRKLEAERNQLDDVIVICKRILRRVPGDWWVRCRLAEAYLAKGCIRRGLRELARGEKISDLSSKMNVMVWSGEVLLWLGEYKQALDKFDKAAGLGCGFHPFIYCWRGAAFLRLGDYRRALEDLDRAIELEPNDLEAFLWRGEAKRLLGRHAEALKDLDFHISRTPDRGGASLWGYFNRALVRYAVGDEAGMVADFKAAPARIKAGLFKKLKIREDKDLSVSEMRDMMTAGLELAKGVRRWALYNNLLWMRPSVSNGARECAGASS